MSAEAGPPGEFARFLRAWNERGKADLRRRDRGEIAGGVVGCAALAASLLGLGVASGQLFCFVIAAVLAAAALAGFVFLCLTREGGP